MLRQLGLRHADPAATAGVRRPAAHVQDMPTQDPVDHTDGPVVTQAPKPHHRVRNTLVATLIALTGFSGAATVVPNSTFPGPLGSAAHLVTTTLAGKHEIPAPGLPAYPQLNPQQLAQAQVAGDGATIVQPVIQDPGGGHHEPIVIIARGPLSNLQQDLQSQGWGPATVFPISQMDLNGKPAVLTLQKNAEGGGLSRDHLRVFDMGTDATGQQQWGIAATRDTNPFMRVHENGGVSFGHETDNNLDGERNLIMNDLLKSDPQAASSWQAVHGALNYNNGTYTTDGYIFSLNV